MNIDIIDYTKDRIADVIEFELSIRTDEQWGWDIDEAYINALNSSFSDNRFNDSISLLAYCNGRVIGRIYAAIIASQFDGSIKAYLDWICVSRSYRHRVVAQTLLQHLRMRLKEKGIDTLIGLIDADENAQRFYQALDNSIIKDQGIWIDT